jgi:hypothetical protein
MKAIRQVLDPQDIEIRLSDDAREYSAECHLAEGDSRAGRALVQGRLACSQHWVAALAML